MDDAVECFHIRGHDVRQPPDIVGQDAAVLQQAAALEHLDLVGRQHIIGEQPAQGDVIQEHIGEERLIQVAHVLRRDLQRSKRVVRRAEHGELALA